MGAPPSPKSVRVQKPHGVSDMDGASRRHTPILPPLLILGALG